MLKLCHYIIPNVSFRCVNYKMFSVLLENNKVYNSNNVWVGVSTLLPGSVQVHLLL